MTANALIDAMCESRRRLQALELRRIAAEGEVAAVEQLSLEERRRESTLRHELDVLIRSDVTAEVVTT